MDKNNVVIRSYKEFISTPPPVRWVVNRIIGEESIAVFYGDGGAKKTYSLLTMGLCVAMGTPWLSYATTQCPVLYVDEENGPVRLHGRLNRILRGMGLTSTDAPSGTVFDIVSFARFKFDEPDSVAALSSIVRKHHYGFIIIDSLCDVMSGDENTKKDTQPVFDNLKALAVECNGATIAILHHANKIEGFRGTTVIRDAPDVLAKVSSAPHSSEVRYSLEKSRDGDEFDFAARCEWISCSDGDDPSRATFMMFPGSPVVAKKDRLRPGEEYVLRFLASNGASSRSDIEAAVDTCTNSQAHAAIMSLARAGRIYRTNVYNESGEVNPRGIPAVYDLIDDANDLDSVMALANARDRTFLSEIDNNNEKY